MKRFNRFGNLNFASRCSSTLSTVDSPRSAFFRDNHDHRHAFAEVPVRHADDRGLSRDT
jgi:hypothetical protein